MKILLALLLAILLSADSSQHNFKAVHFYGNTLEDVQLVFNEAYTDFQLLDEILKQHCPKVI